MGRIKFALGLGLGLAAAWAGQALTETRLAFEGEGDRTAMSWTVLAAGQVVCTDPYVRPREREIECRNARRE